ncbi:hypothetical protein HPB47_000610 [Ixodes persulcatus]|uniref:Uncharacterized protein n=1 Tax=Ixodes persulcatus TaxID=34615 RepID=A0AC60PRC4_IXOPE|nr:hypothetical protein HPB47_000610 [Ixodes persulcatus]
MFALSRLRCVSMKYSLLILALVALLVLFCTWAEAECPSIEDVSSDCSFTTFPTFTTCTPSVDDNFPQSAPVCPSPVLPEGGCKDNTGSITCSNVRCPGVPCCTDACGKPYCLNPPSWTVSI